MKCRINLVCARARVWLSAVLGCAQLCSAVLGYARLHSTVLGCARLSGKAETKEVVWLIVPSNKNDSRHNKTKQERIIQRVVFVHRPAKQRWPQALQICTCPIPSSIKNGTQHPIQRVCTVQCLRLLAYCSAKKQKAQTRSQSSPQASLHSCLGVVPEILGKHVAQKMP